MPIAGDQAVGRRARDQLVHGRAGALGGDGERPVLDEGAGVAEVGDVLAGRAVARGPAAADRVGPGVANDGLPTLELLQLRTALADRPPGVAGRRETDRTWADPARLDRHQRVVHTDGVTDRHRDGADRAGRRSVHHVLELHGLDHHQGIPPSTPSEGRTATSSTVPCIGAAASTIPTAVTIRGPGYDLGVRGILSAAGYVPYRRLDRAEINRFFGTGGGKGTRAVASHDEDTSTLGVEAARLALRARPGLEPGALWFATSTPAYLDKTNATVLHAALRLPSAVPAFDFGGALRSGAGALQTALTNAGPVLVVSADTRNGLATSGDESIGGDAGAAILVGDDGPGGAVIAEWLGSGSATDEFVDRWRAPGEQRAKLWEERFGETRYLALGREAWERALKNVGLAGDEVDQVIITGMHSRATKALVRHLGIREGRCGDDLAGTVGQSGTAHPGLLLAAVLEEEAAGITDVAGTCHRARAPGRRRRRIPLSHHGRAAVVPARARRGRAGGGGRPCPTESS